MLFIKSLFPPIIVAGFSLAAFFVIGFVLYALITLLWTPSDRTKDRHDAIIILTGAEGRIEKGFELLLEDGAPKLLISGVLGETITLHDIVHARAISDANKNRILDHCCIDLDAVATTTEENAIESTKWIQNNHVKTFLLVTSASHMPRAYLQFYRALDDTVTIIPYPVHNQSAYSLVMSSQFWLYTAREYIKYLGSWLRLEKIQE